MLEKIPTSIFRNDAWPKEDLSERSPRQAKGFDEQPW